MQAPLAADWRDATPTNKKGRATLAAILSGKVGRRRHALRRLGGSRRSTGKLSAKPDPTLKLGISAPLNPLSQEPVPVHIMKINSTIPSPASLPKARTQTTANGPGRTAAPGTAVAGDAATAGKLQSTAFVRSAAAPFDSQRVAEIRDAIAQGQLQIDAEKIADRLIEDVRDQLGKKRSAD
ncbi:MAG: flagellar biosynthesis anti-sigma factor FlgM [Sulfuritalea sp.]|nr:flagellar biosynthesis anti-sigma factor FlgM [Sulfuritalea sp.]